jgi:O-antigen ligase
MFNARSDATAWDRVERSRLAWEYIQVHPFGDHVWNRTFYLIDLGDQGFEPHNFIVQALDKQGWISALLLFSLLGVILWIGWRTRRYSKLALVMTCYLVFYLVFCLFNTNFDAVENVTLFALAGALILHAHRAARVQTLSAGASSASHSGPGGPTRSSETPDVFVSGTPMLHSGR